MGIRCTKGMLILSVLVLILGIATINACGFFLAFGGTAEIQGHHTSFPTA
jgi:hypothetical protein